MFYISRIHHFNNKVFKSFKKILTYKNDILMDCFKI